jgi:SHS family lactate transporter-like MFS transporter
MINSDLDPRDGNIGLSTSPTSWTPAQKSAVIASLLSWTFDAFDFFLMVFVLKAIAAEFATPFTEVTFAIVLTLAMRPIGAYLFGRAADRYGRRPTLIAVIVLYSILEFSSAFAPTLASLLVIRALFGIAMGGVWGVGSSLTMESIPISSRGIVSGMLQAGYPLGYLAAALVYAFLFDSLGWRGLFMIGVAPALLSIYVIRNVQESPTWRNRQETRHVGTLEVLKAHWALAIYAVLLMTAFNFFSHSTQDLYPTFLQVEHGFTPHEVGTIAVVYNIGAMLGGLVFGSLSERIGRRRAIVSAALLSLPIIPLWTLSSSPVLLAAGAFLMQFMVQGAWGVVPAHLNELSPADARGTFPGVVYQLGNLLASVNTSIQASIATHYDNRYSWALAGVAAVAAMVVALLTGFGGESKGVRFSARTTGVQPRSASGEDELAYSRLDKQGGPAREPGE